MFSEDEQSKLCSAFNVDNNNLQSILDTSVFIFEQAAYHTAKPAIFTQQLKNIQLSEDKASAMGRTVLLSMLGVLRPFYVGSLVFLYSPLRLIHQLN